MTAQNMKQSFDILAKAAPTAFVEADHDEIFVNAANIGLTSTFGRQLVLLGWSRSRDNEGWIYYV